MKNDHLIHINFSPERSLQEQIREHLLEKIHQGVFGNKALPSCRKLAQMLNVSRNTIVLVYEKLVDEGFLISQQRSGFFTNPDAYISPLDVMVDSTQTCDQSAQKWTDKFKVDFSEQRNIQKTPDWQSYPYPFLFGQPEDTLFPSNHWRECVRLAQRKTIIKDWISDHIDCDDKLLIKQLQTSVLSKRGISASQDEILVTIGTQNSLFLLAQLLTDSGTVVGVEDPGYPDARNIFSTFGAKVVPLSLDNQGIELNHNLALCDYIYTTPSHQVPTNVTMSMERRTALLDYARKNNTIVIEDDYDSEINLNTKPSPALKSMDKDGSVIYVGSLSKSLSPGLRIGFMVADRTLINQARKLRRLMYRHPPANNQRTSALFISLGYYDSYLAKIRRSYTDKWTILRQSLERHLPDCITNQTLGGSAFWLKLPAGVSGPDVVRDAMKLGVLVEDGDLHFHSPEQHEHHYLRLGFSGICADNIEPGIMILAKVIKKASAPTTTKIWY
ncbi:MocR-like pyridoxine biosynthesis transcription factor PdxR [Vibrio salinus]|uniref:MocR-like pyridoxine biosynthesis transcription factor PdxR n=1 Tax=Vibrio salinus TaxID=2899784 RepID=UPI001E317619|nr:PLP-dependent aminotransferase family protein [Vibrio salinus]MCE0492771.1 PLP-dependent aminotransferase family protein [Vibrio salinus]